MSEVIDSLDQASVYNELSKTVQFRNTERLLNHLNVKQGQRILDIGCGTGLLDSIIVDKIGCSGHLTGIDPDAERLQVAKDRFPGCTNVEFHVCASNSFPVENDNPYDSVVSNMVYHWVTDQEKVESFARIFQALKPGGVLAASLPLAVPRNIRLLAEMYANKHQEFHSAFENAVASSYRFVSLDWIREHLSNIGFKNIVTEEGGETLTVSTVEDFINWVQATYANTVLGQFNYKALYEEVADNDNLLRSPTGDIDASYRYGYFMAQKP